MRADFSRTGVFVDQHAFDVCRVKIQHWMDIATLMPYLVRYGLNREGIVSVVKSCGRGTTAPCHGRVGQQLPISCSNPPRYGLMRGDDDIFHLSDKVPPSQRKTHLFDSLTNVPYGHHRLYMCIREAKESLGHQSAAKMLKENGEQLCFMH